MIQAPTVSAAWRNLPVRKALPGLSTMVRVVACNGRWGAISGREPTEEQLVAARVSLITFDDTDPTATRAVATNELGIGFGCGLATTPPRTGLRRGAGLRRLR